MDPQTAAAWQSAANSVQNAAGVIATGNLNYATRNWNEQQLEKQRAWALEDRDYANQYNSPQAVMARAKAAGINPNYAVTNGQVMTASSPVRATPSQSWTPQTPEIKKETGITDSLNLAMMQQQLSNLKSQGANIDADTFLKYASTRNTAALGEGHQWDVNQKNRLSGLLDEIKQAGYDKTLNEISNMQKRWDLMQQQYDLVPTQWIEKQLSMQSNREVNSANLKLIAEKVLTEQMNRSKTAAERDKIREYMTTMDLDQDLKRLDIDLKSTFNSWTDPQATRLVQKILMDAQGKGLQLENDPRRPGQVPFIR